MSERVALRLVLPGVVVTWFVTGFLDPGKVDGPHPALLEACLSGKASLRWRVGEGWQRGRHDSICGFLRWSRNSWSG